MAPPRVLVVGGGIGGLATALALHRVGIPARVFESVAELRPLGVGINLLPHSARVLADLGLLSELTATGIETSALGYYNKFGQQIWSEPRGVLAGYHLPQISIHRGDLQMILLRAVLDRLGPRAVIPGRRLIRADTAGGKVRAMVADQAQPEEADILVGADGIHSVVRRQFYPDEGAPRYSGRLLWRAVTESAPYLDGRTMIMAGHQHQKFVCYPISRSHFAAGRSLVNWIAELTEPGQTPPRQDWSREVPAGRFAAEFAGWRFGWLDVPDLIARAAAIYEYPMVDRDPLPAWSLGGITLLGDAAHPMYPIGSNGASQAILDAAALARHLADSTDPVEGLARYEAERRPPTSAIVLANRMNGPEQVMQLAEERAPGGFSSIEEVIPRPELEAIAARYKQTAGFSKDQVNAGN